MGMTGGRRRGEIPRRLENVLAAGTRLGGGGGGGGGDVAAPNVKMEEGRCAYARICVLCVGVRGCMWVCLGVRGRACGCSVCVCMCACGLLPEVHLLRVHAKARSRPIPALDHAAHQSALAHDHSISIGT